MAFASNEHKTFDEQLGCLEKNVHFTCL